jgi:hypothetical protein
LRIATGGAQRASGHTLAHLARIVALAFIAGGMLPLVHSALPADAGSCGTNWGSRKVPPPTIRVLNTRTGGVWVVDFRDYVGMVMASGEFPTYDPLAVLEAGATAVKQYGWYYALEGHHRSAYRTPSGVCYDVRDDTNDQLFKPEFALPTAKQLDAVAATWNLTLRKNGRFFLTTYRYGNDVPCGSDADGWKLYERSMVHCADQGWDLRKIQVRYYQPNIEFVWSGSTPADSGDTVAPRVTTPQMRLRTGTTLSNVITTVRWSASDAGTGVVDYNLQHRAGGGHWHNVILSQPAATYKTLHLRPDRSHQFRVRARDAAGNLSAFVSGPKFYPHILQTGAATLSGTWKSAPDANASGGETRYATQPGAAARLHFQGRAIGIVAQRGPGRGQASILLDGKKVATIDLRAPVLQERRVVYSARWSILATHTISLVVAGTAGHPRVDLDAFVILR